MKHQIQWKTVAGIALGASLIVGATAWSDAPADPANTDQTASMMSCPMMGGGMMSDQKNAQNGGMMGGKSNGMMSGKSNGMMSGKSSAQNGGMMGMMKMMQSCQKMMGGMMSCPMMGSGMMGGTNGAAEKPTQAVQEKKLQRADITVDAQGFTPATIGAQAGKPLELTFTRKSDDTCAKEVVVPDYKIKVALPLNKPVKVKFTPRKSGNISFACGMDMVRGTVVVQ